MPVSSVCALRNDLDPSICRIRCLMVLSLPPGWKAVRISVEALYTRREVGTTLYSTVSALQSGILI